MNAAPSTNQARNWFITYATTEADGCPYTCLQYGVVEAADIKQAEEAGLRRHAFEGFSDCEPFEPLDGPSGEWTVYQSYHGNHKGFRAFRSYLEGHGGAGDHLLWIENIREIGAADAQVLMRHLHRKVSSEQRKAEQAEQLRLRGVDAP